MRKLFLVSFVAVALFAGNASAATFRIVNNDTTGEGFLDATPVAPVGGNTGATLGAQRLNAFQFAADIWAARLDSSVEIIVDAQFDSLGCTPGAGVLLGAAGAMTFFRDFTAARRAETWYPSALADALAGSDLGSGLGDIFAQFNSDVGGAGCDIGWYYGFDRNAGPGEIDLVSVLIHELGHGLGFATPMNAFFGSKMLGYDDAYMVNLENHCNGLSFPVMSNTERALGATAVNALHWTGSAVSKSAGDLGSGTHASCHVQMYAPAFFEAGSSVSHFSTALSPDDIMEPQYVGPNHDIERSVQLLIDVGWLTMGGPACGDFTADGLIASTDAFGALQASVGNQACMPGVCDVNASSAITATDALLILRYAVGQSVRLTCGASSGSCAASNPVCNVSTAEEYKRFNPNRPHIPRPDSGASRPDAPRPTSPRSGLGY